MTSSTIGSVLLTAAALLLAAAALTLRHGLAHRLQEEELSTKLTGATLGLVLLAAIALAFGLDALLDIQAVPV